ncbi:MAG: bifunctional UDP-4-keto-pentose/UDP-xylose synthase [Candidatus Omnitrophica bacterium]|nr:bifunctional UDP-4-keto-pentose/UDP-xylose synthase [Candidatus Omnitrophota bacterium]
MKVLILGVNGFIGSHLSENILKTTDWEVYGLDVESNKISDIVDNPRFNFVKGDVTVDKDKEWIEHNIKECDVVLPLVAIATPATYIKNPLKVFELDFETNLEIIKKAVKYKTRVVFPSTSEVYGMCTDEAFDEDKSNFILGPTNKQRWIYSCCKQLLDRVMWAYGFEKDFKFTIFRPYNWIGPKLDDIYTTKEGGSRVLTQFIGNVLKNEPMKLVNGGHQKRCFLYIDDGIKCLTKIIGDKSGVTNGMIFNIGNPKNNVTIRELASRVRKIFYKHPIIKSTNLIKKIDIEDVSEKIFYGEGYQDVSFRVPSIKKARDVLGWEPLIGLDAALRKTIDYYLADNKFSRKVVNK